LEADVEGKAESELLYVELETFILIADENVDRVDAEIGRIGVNGEFGHAGYYKATKSTGRRRDRGRHALEMQ
jgi:hypothetical protein